jgi:hypothetical protein
MKQNLHFPGFVEIFTAFIEKISNSLICYISLISKTNTQQKMKTRLILTMLILIILAVSCIPSLYPLYREKDLIFDERLLGLFNIEGDKSDGDTWEFEKLDWQTEGRINNDWNQFRTGKTYKMTDIEDEKKAEFAVHLLKLGKNYYLDFFPVKYNIENYMLDMQLMPAHIFGKIEFVNKNIVMHWFDGGFLTDMIDSNKIKISHKMLENSILLTANTEELQKFVRKYGDNPQAFLDEDPDTMYRIPPKNIGLN